MFCEIGKIVKLYEEYPEYKGHVFVNTPYGKKCILEANIVEKKSNTYTLNTKSFNLIGSPKHRVMCNGKWTFLKNININDIIDTINGKEKVISCYINNKKYDLYDIQVDEVNQYYSNGILSHNSSFLETIPFALFGRTARDIKQSQIVNWKNKKQCQVVFRFKINDDVYEINRQLKPNKLEVFKNGELIDQDAHKSDYQGMFEDIFGMDVKMFMSLIHSNVNSSGNILGMKKTEKRVFLERMFGLIIYSDMNKLCNNKLRDVDQKKYKATTDISSADDKIKSAEQMKVKFRDEINSKKSSIENVDEIKEQLDKIKEDNPTISDDINNVGSEITLTEGIYNQLQLDHQKYMLAANSKIENIDKEIDSIDKVEEKKSKNAEIQKKIDKIVEKAGTVDDIIKEIETVEGQKAKYTEVFNKTGADALLLFRELFGLEVDLKTNQESLDLLADGKCPTCGQDVKDPVAHHKRDISSIKKKITARKKKEKKFDDISSEHQELIAQCNNKTSLLHRTKDTLNSLMVKIVEVEDGKNKDELVKEKDKLTAECEVASKDNLIERTKLSDKKQSLENKRKDLMTIEGRINSKQKEYDIAVSTAKEIKRHVASLEEMIKEQDGIIVQTKENIKEVKGRLAKLNTLVDYINAIKVILKDENIKQYTIKKIMPFINKQTNEYLSEVNYGFYVNVDKWLDVEIKGPGIRNASYGSLSSGEKKGVDLAIQLSLLDVSQTMIGVFPDILVFDELLDGSIDSIGMNQLMKIIKTKQKETDSKVFIITHRSEVDQDLIDNEYKVVKNNSYSKVYV